VLAKCRDALGKYSCSRLEIAATLREVHLQDCVKVTVKLIFLGTVANVAFVATFETDVFFVEGALAFFIVFFGGIFFSSTQNKTE
jgi:hypothetical protein